MDDVDWPALTERVQDEAGAWVAGHCTAGSSLDNNLFMTQAVSNIHKQHRSQPVRILIATAENDNQAQEYFRVQS